MKVASSRMQLSLSVRIAEGFLSKEEAVMDLPDLADLAVSAGYDAVCMRASQVGVQSSDEEIRRAAGILQARHLAVSMVTGDFDVVYNNARGPACLRNIVPHLDLAEALGAPLVRVCMKERDDIPAAREAADAAAERGLELAHQCHTQSLFETVDGIVGTLQEIDRPNFGLIYEPANLEGCRQDYGAETIRHLAPWIFNVYLQNQKLNPEGTVTLDTWCHGPYSFDIIGIPESGGIDFAAIFAALRDIGYSRTVTVHQSAPENGGSPMESARETAGFLKALK